MPTNLFQRVGDFFEQRKQFRAAALTALRKREGLPIPVDENNNPLETRFDDDGNAHYYKADGTQAQRVMWQGAGKDGKPGAFAIGHRKGPDRELADLNWHRADSEFEILEVAEDGRKLSDELRDLDRDAAGLEMAQQVSHGAESEQAPGLELGGTSDEEIDRVLQDYLRRGVKER